MHLSDAGHDVVVLDNLSRRGWDEELEAESLTPIASLEERVDVWQEISGLQLSAEVGDLLDWEFLIDLLERHRPEAIVHFAEQRSAPYSMIDREHAVFTHHNNVLIHIRDTCRCIETAIENPPQLGERVNILNQMTETHRVRELAELISEKTGTPIEYVTNPRNEADENDLHVVNERFLGYGLEPTTLEDGIMTEVSDIARKYAGRCDRSKIPSTSLWRKVEAGQPA